MTDLDPFLAPLRAGDPGDDSMVRHLALRLAANATSPAAQVDACFRWVRDRVAHTVDAGGGPLTCAPADVLTHRTGFCYAKAHLLVAMLRSLGLPSALCYQRLRLDDQDPAAGFCLHGLAAVFLPEHGWVRLDPRGDRPGIVTRFAPPAEQLAFVIAHPGECDLPSLYPQPRADVLASFARAGIWRTLLASLPDWPAPLRQCRVRWARRAELDQLQQVEMDAGELFREHGLASVADAAPLPLDELERACRQARLFVAEAEGQLAGFCMVDALDGEGHLAELSVRPALGGRGIGSELLQYALSWARELGFQSMTLSTFRNVPFNAPFYARRGFVPIAAALEGPDLRQKRGLERARGLAEELRVAMRLDLG